MQKPSADLSCNNTVVKYVIAENEVAPLKVKIERIAGKEPVIYLESQLEDKMVELTVMAARLTPGAAEELDNLQKEVSEVGAYRAGSSETSVELDLFDD